VGAEQRREETSAAERRGELIIVYAVLSEHPKTKLSEIED